MTATIKLGKAGRLVVPKAVRDRLRQMEAGTLMKLECEDAPCSPPGKSDDDDSCEPRMEMRPDGLPVFVGWKNFDAVKAVKAARKSAEDRLLARLGR